MRPIIAFDIDGTLCEEQEDYHNYKDAVPILDTIKCINKLYKMNLHFVVIYTARFEEDREVTRMWLKKHNVKYHNLVMNKFRADLYVDNDSIKPSTLKNVVELI